VILKVNRQKISKNIKKLKFERKNNGKLSGCFKNKLKDLKKNLKILTLYYFNGNLIFFNSIFNLNKFFQLFIISKQPK
jgi:hypothetical protein